MFVVAIWVLKMGVPQNGWFIMENPIKMDDFGGTPIYGNIHILFLDSDRSSSPRSEA